MVSISLRAYLNEINDLIDQRQIDEAIANCRHILETYPKHVDTYRLLGKAYLEEQRYSDASDILQRVLSSVPEDFISQVGMSIIREDEGNLDSAVYHMERAFETQPSNHAIQDELRRLHSQRDGVDLKRVRLTRGALARMYAHGNLYEQAISELMAALSEDPNRYDLQSLLADMYYHTDKKVDAAETCTKILEKLPHCLNANRLLTIILEESGRPEEAHRYRQRWAALDPYAAFVGEEYSLIEQVPDNQVSVDKFEWDPSSLLDSETGQPAWASSLGVSLSGEEEPSEPLPDWLSDSTATPDEAPLDMDADLDEEEFRPTEMLPESLATAAGFEDDSSTVEGDHIDLFPSIEDDEEDDWLDSKEPGDEPIGVGEGDPFAAMPDDEESVDDWLATADEPDTAGEADLFAAAGDEEGEDDWLTSLDTGSEEVDQAEMVEETDIFATPSGEEESDDDWLGSLETPEEGQPPATPEAEETDADAWLGSLESAADELAGKSAEEPESEAELPDFLKEAGWGPDSGTFDESSQVQYEESDAAEPIEEEEPDIEEADIPDWIQQMAPSEDASPEPDLQAEADPEWMKSMQAPSEADSPAWLKELGGLEDAEEDAVESPPSAEEKVDIEPASKLPEMPEQAEESPAGAEIEPDEMDMAWLENLAAKQGIPDEELVTSAEQRAEVTEDHKPTTGELAESPPADEPEPDTDWLQQLGQDEEEAEAEQAEPMGDSTAEWLSAIAEDEEVTPQLSLDDDDTISRFLAARDEEVPVDIPDPDPVEPQPEAEAPVSPVDEESDDLDMDWLSEISEEAAAEAAPEPEAPIAPETPTADEPADVDWMSELDQPTDEPAQPEAVSPVDEEADDLSMDWLSEISEEAAAEAAPEPEAPIAPETPTADEPADVDWMSELDQLTDEPAQPEADSPVDEEADDLSMDWLSEISGEAAAEAAPEPEADLAPDLPVTEEPTTLPVDEEQDDFDTSWLEEIGHEAAEEAGVGTEVDSGAPPPEADAESTQPSAVSPVDEEADDVSMDWLSEISDEAAAEAAPEPEADTVSDVISADEPAEEDWLAELEQPEIEAELTQPSAAAPVDEEADDLSMDWLNEISEEAAAEAAPEPEADITPDMPVADEPATLPVDEEQDDFDTSWLEEIGQEAAEEAGIGAEDEFPTPEAASEPTQPSAVSPVDEEADDLNMDWLSEISDEAAAEAAPEPEADLTPDLPVADEPVEDDWLANLEQPETEAEPTQPSAADPVDEEADDFDMDWLDDLSEEAAAESVADTVAAPDDPVPGAPEEPTVDDDLLAELDDALTEITQPSAAAPVDEEQDDFDTSWLDGISEQATAEAAVDESTETEPVEEVGQEEDLLADLEDALADATRPTTAILSDEELDGELDTVQQIEAPEAAEEAHPSPVDEEQDDFNTAWLDDIGAQAALEAAGSEIEAAIPEAAPEEDQPEEDWLTRLEAEDDLASEDRITNTDAWLLSMEEEAYGDDDSQPSLADTGEWLGSMGIEQEETPIEPEDVETAPEPDVELTAESSDEAQEELLPAHEVEAPAAEIQPTQDEEWKPEAEVDAAPIEIETEAQLEPEPAPPAEPTAPADDGLDSARQAVSDGDMEKALDTYGKLIKRGKMIDEIISDLNDATLRHPINVRLWQTLGDAYMRTDNLQDALDAYSKAEDLLR